MSSRPHVTETITVVRVQPLAIAVFAIIASIVVALNWNSPVRAAIVLLFLILGPGLAIVELLRIRDPVQEIALAIGTSLALGTGISVTLLYVGRYSYELAFTIVVAITVVALLIGAFRRGDRPVVSEPRSRRTDA